MIKIKYSNDTIKEYNEFEQISDSYTVISFKQSHIHSFFIYQSIH